jgi:hypothetical protein
LRSAHDSLAAGQPAVGFLHGVAGRAAFAALLVAGDPEVQVEVGMARIVEHQPQSDLASLRRDIVYGAAGLAPEHPAGHLAVDQQLGAHHLVDAIEQAPGPAVPGHGRQAGGEREARALAAAPR